VTREGHFAVLGTQPALAESAFTLEKGAIGGPWKTERGWHVIKVEDKKDESVREFDQVKQVIARQLGSKNSQDFYRSQLETARKDVGVKPDSAAIKSWLSQKKTAREMFNEAQAAGPPEARIEAYRKLLTEYPAADVSPQSQFMIGFIYSEEIKDYDKAEAAFKELIARWPKAELAPSAQWMIEHMRTEEAPPFLDLTTDSTGVHNAAATKGTKKP
jgi:tetratricopeptide (TPR) repeat protein